MLDRFVVELELLEQHNLQASHARPGWKQLQVGAEVLDYKPLLQNRRQPAVGHTESSGSSGVTDSSGSDSGRVSDVISGFTV